MRKRLVGAATATVAALVVSVAAAQTSTERTSMPDYCSNRDITCILPAEAAASRAPNKTTATGAGPATSPTVVITPAAPNPGTAGLTVQGTTGTPGRSAGATVQSVPTLSSGVPTAITNVPTAITNAPTLSTGATGATGNTVGGRGSIGGAGSAPPGGGLGGR